MKHVDKAGTFNRLMIAQDVGSAIKGPERGDIYFGSGDAAGSWRASPSTPASSSCCCRTRRRRKAQATQATPEPGHEPIWRSPVTAGAPSPPTKPRSGTTRRARLAPVKAKPRVTATAPAAPSSVSPVGAPGTNRQATARRSAAPRPPPAPSPSSTPATPHRPRPPQGPPHRLRQARDRRAHRSARHAPERCPCAPARLPARRPRPRPQDRAGHHRQGRRGAEAATTWPTPSASSARGVLRRNVPAWLDEPELRAVVLGYTTAGVRHGGEGALYVQLRRSSRREDADR